MKTKKLLVLVAVLAYLISSCSSQPSNSDEDLATQDSVASADTGAEAAPDTNTTKSNDEFSDSSNENKSNQNSNELSLNENQGSDNQLQSNSDMNNSQAGEVAQNPNPQPEPQPQPVEQTPVTPIVQEAVPVVPTTPEPAPQKPVENKITNIEFKGNETGGTLVISGTTALSYKEFSNESPSGNKQLVLEFYDTKLEKKASRPLYLKDFKGSIGAISSYYDNSKNSTRVVLELRGNAPNYLVQPEQNSVLIVTNETAVATDQVVNTNVIEKQHEQDSLKLNEPKVTFDSFENKKFEGKEISCNFSNANTKDLLLAIGSEVGVNLVVDDIPESTVDIDIQSVPWDHCVALIMKIKKLGFSRIGNIIRITTVQNIKTENEEEIKNIKSSEDTAPIKVRLFPVNYAEGKELEKFIKPLLSEKRGSANFDSRTNSFIVTDTVPILEQVGTMIKNLDTPPKQVLIEGKIIEASTSLSKQVGINWGFTGQSIGSGKTRFQPLFNMGGAVSSSGDSSGTSSIGFQVGTIDFIGNLTASLQLLEKEDKVKVLSSPRIVTINNKKAGITTVNKVVSASINNLGVPVTGEPLELKVSLDVTPSINNDGSVKMEVKVKRDFAGVAPDPRLSGAAPKYSRDIDTNILVKNGQTSVIGGIFQNDTSSGESGISGLKDIPIIGFLFRNRQQLESNTELLVFLTPRVVNFGEGESSN